MKGNDKIIYTLNQRLAEELTAIHQYIVHASMCSNWGYQALSGYIMGRARAEMRHADLLIDRILFLEGIPTVSRLNPIQIGATVEAMYENDKASEQTAIQRYNESAAQAMELRDDGSRKLFESILADEEDHINDLEARMVQVRQMGIGQHLAEQIGETA